MHGFVLKSIPGRMRSQHVCAKMATVLVGKLFVKTFKKLYVHCDIVMAMLCFTVKKKASIAWVLAFG